MMLRVAQKLVQPLVTNATRLILPISPSCPTARFYGSNGLNVDPVAVQMINYAIGVARSQKSSESYAQGLLVLEQCLSANVREGDSLSENTKGVVLLAISTLLSERGDLSEAVEKLESIQGLGHSSLGVRVAAVESLVGLNLETGQDVASSMHVDKCLELFRRNPEDGGTSSSGELEVLQARVDAVKGLVELVQGNIENAEACFERVLNEKGCFGNIMLSRGEFFHATGNFQLAKEFYQKAIQEKSETSSFSDLHNLAACNMVPDEVLLGATCALGQLEAHSGNFSDGEEILTRALTKAEEHFGSHHPKVGVILTCIALMFRYKAKLEHSSSILIQEGLYRKAIDMLKAPSLETEGEESMMQRSDIIALARGGYAEILSVQQNRKAEGERMKKWAESRWRNRRLSLAQALEFSQPSSKTAVIDTRTNRAL